MAKAAEWRPIAGYEGLYEVSDDGRVRTRKSGHYRLRKIKTNPITGYCELALNKDGVSKTHRVHRLVAQAFLDNPDDLPCVNHKDENKQNNCVDNLEWCTVKYNNDYSSYRRRKRVLAYDVEGNLLASFESEQLAAQFLGVTKPAISAAITGMHETCMGLLLRHEKGG